MPNYTFHPGYENGLFDPFVSRELDDDDRARVYALHILDQHPSANHVVVWSGARKVLTRQRIHPDLASLLGQFPSKN